MTTTPASLPGTPRRHAGGHRRVARPRTWVVWLLWVAVMSALVALVARSGVPELPFAVFAPTYSLAGAFLVTRVPSNRFGLLLFASGLGWALMSLPTYPETWSLPIDPGSLVFGLFFLSIGFILLTFPDGGLPSARWRLVAWGLPVTEAMAIMGANFGPILANVLNALSIGFLLVAASAPVLRYRYSSGQTRLQLRWPAFAIGAGLAGAIGALALQGVSDAAAAPFGLLAFLSALVGLPASLAVAVSRYRLFEIDVIISRSLSFGVLVVFIGGVYVGIVVGLGSLVGRGGGSGFGLSVVATAVVALGFQPVRVRVEGWANRLVFGKRATPYEVLARFSHRAAEESDDEVVGRIPRLIVDGTGAESAALWVRTDGGFATVSVWPEDGSARTLDDRGAFEDPDGDVSLPVIHDGEVLGGVSLVAARGGSITPPEMELLTNLVNGLGLTLRNSRLTAALRRQVAELERSRDRVVSAADEARRSLEHDLDSGPQQQLVAVKVKLGPIRRLAEQAGAQRTAVVLADIEAQTGDAIRAVRDFAAGIYPPLLGAEGLAVALGQEVHKAALPVVVVADGVGRYPREVESAVYFSILEALQNTAKYGQASRAVVTLSAADGGLSFEVSDDGVGFDPATVTYGAGLNGIRDRLDTIGATLTITSTPGHGTLITGTVPIDQPTLSTAGIT